MSPHDGKTDASLKQEDEIATLKVRIATLQAQLSEKDQVADAFRNERDFYKEMLDSVEAQISVVDHHKGKMVFINRAIFENAGHSLEEIYSHNGMELLTRKLVAEEDIETVRRQMGQVIATKKPVTVEIWNLNADGTRSRISWTARPMMDDQVDVKYLIASGIDITARWNAEEALRKEKKLLDTILETTEAMITVMDMKTNKIVTFNRVAQEMSGYTAEDYSHLPSPEIAISIPPEERETFRRNFENIITTAKATSHEFTSINKNGERVRTYWTARAAYDDNGAPEYMVASGIDVTARWKAEIALRQAKRQAETANALKDQFVALVSHDLRSPLYSLSIGLESATSKGGDSLAPAIRDILAKCQDNINGLLGMVGRLLDIDRLKSGKIKLDKSFVNIRELVSQVYFQLGSLADDKKITLVNDAPPASRLFVDNNLFQQVIQNLVGNAIKFCGEGATVTVSIKPESPNTLIVEDTGGGIPPELLHDIFKPEVFTSTLGTHGEKGNGLGLPLCHNIISAHGGDLRVETALGEGTRFYCALPEVKAISLIVDDQRVVREQVAGILKGMGVEVMEAENG